MSDELPSGWMSSFVDVLLLVSLGIMLIPTARFGPAYIWDIMYPPGGPMPLTTPFMSMTIPLWFLNIFILYFGYQRTKRFIDFNKTCYKK